MFCFTKFSLQKGATKGEKNVQVYLGPIKTSDLLQSNIHDRLSTKNRSDVSDVLGLIVAVGRFWLLLLEDSRNFNKGGRAMSPAHWPPYRFKHSFSVEKDGVQFVVWKLHFSTWHAHSQPYTNTPPQNTWLIICNLETVRKIWKSWKALQCQVED